MRWTENEKALLEYGRVLDNIELLQRRIKSKNYDEVFTETLCLALFNKAKERRAHLKKTYKFSVKT